MSFLKRLTSKKSSSTPNSSAKNAIPQLTRDVNTPTRSTPTRRPQGVATPEEPPPPAYTARTDNTIPQPIAGSSAGQPAVVPVIVPQAEGASGDSPYAFLAQFDTVFLIDDSGSMAGRSWRETSEALGVITPICTEHDADGIDIYFLNHRIQRTNSGIGGYKNVTTTSKVNELFTNVRPSGGTPTGTRLNQLLKPYLVELEADLKKVEKGAEPTVKPLNVIVITDGVPSDDVESVIVNAAKKLDNLNAEPWQVGIQFFQVGQEPEAADELKDLDDALAKQHNIRDMVDTVPWSGEEGTELSASFVLKVVMGSINRRLDRKSV